MSATETVTEAQNAVASDPASYVNRLSGLPHPVVQNQEVSFHFKKPRKGPDGKEPTDELGQPIAVRPTVKLQVPLPTFEGVISALENEKTRDYILELVGEAVKAAARGQVDDETSPVNRQEELRLDHLTLSFLANIPKAERRGAGIAKETWAEWEKDYISTMIEATGKDAEKVGNAAKIFTARLQPAKTNKPVLKFLMGQLSMWAERSQNLEEFQDVWEFLTKKGDEFLAADEQALLANL